MSDYVIIGYDETGHEFTRMTMHAASASIENIRADARLMLSDFSGRIPASFEVTTPERERAINSRASLVEVASSMMLWLEAERLKGYPEGSMASLAVPAMVSKARAALADAKQGGVS